MIDESGGMGGFHDKVTLVSVTSSSVTVNSSGLEGSIIWNISVTFIQQLAIV